MRMPPKFAERSGGRWPRAIPIAGETWSTPPRWWRLATYSFTPRCGRPAGPEASSNDAASCGVSQLSYNRKVMTMRSSQVGLFLGALLGLALVIEGFGDMLIVALIAFVGWVVARVVEGELDLGDVLSGGKKNRTGR